MYGVGEGKVIQEQGRASEDAVLNLKLLTHRHGKRIHASSAVQWCSCMLMQ